MAYKYIIYKLYRWALKKKNDTPVFNVIVTMSFIHILQLMTFYHILLKYGMVYNIYKSNNGLWIGIFFLFFLVSYYFVIYNKARWEGYLLLFNDEDKRTSRRGTAYVLFYLIGSIALFFGALILLFG